MDIYINLRARSLYIIFTNGGTAYYKPIILVKLRRSETTTMTTRANEFVMRALVTLILVFIILVVYIKVQYLDFQPKPKSCYPRMGLRVANSFDLA